MRSTAVLLLLTIATVAVAEEDLGKLVADLDAKTHAVRLAALNSLRNGKDPRAIPLLVKALPGFDTLGQYYGVMVLDGYPKRPAKRALYALLGAEPSYLRLLAAAALSRRGERSAGLVIVRELKAEGLTTSERTVYLARLYGVRDPQVILAIRGFLMKDQDPSLIGAALYFLYFAQDEGSMPAARALEKDPRPGVQALAAAFLLRFGDQTAAAVLAQALRTGKIAYSEFSRVKTFLYSTPRIADAILEALTERLTEETDVNILRGAIQLLGRSRHLPAVPAMKKLLDHKSSTVARAAFDVLAGLSAALTPETLLPLLESEDEERRLWAADALRRMDDFSGLPVALDLLKTGENVRRLDAARVLGGFKSSAAVDALLDALMDDYLIVRSMAFSSLTRVLSGLFPYRRLNLQTVGYTYTAAPARRKAAVLRLRAWWKENRTKSW